MSIDIASLVKKALQTKPADTEDTKSKQQVYVMEDGEEYINPGIPGLVAASEKLLAVNKGVADLDDREDFKFKRIFSTHDLVRERVVRDAGKLRRQMMFRLSKMRNLKPIHPGYFDSYVQGQIVGNPLASPLEEINPLHLLENSRRMTLMGPGGIGSDDAVTNDMQAVHGSTFGFLSPLEGPESSRAGIDTRFSWGTKLGSNGRLYQKFYDRRSGKYRYLSPEDLDGLTVKLPD